MWLSFARIARRKGFQKKRGSRPIFPRTVAPGIPMSSGRFPLGQWPFREAGLIYMAQNARGNTGRLSRFSWNASLWAILARESDVGID